MALIECYECKGKVSSKAKACPHCGLPIEVEIGYYENGQMQDLTFKKDGVWDGLQTEWYENGQKMSELNFKDGLMHGLETTWRESGQKTWERTLKDGEQDGLETAWYQNGQKKSEVICKDGKVMSAKVWKPNGEKCPVTSLKDGNGLLALWHVNGQKSSEAKFKNGKREGRMIYYNYDGTEMGSIKYMDGERIYDFD